MIWNGNGFLRFAVFKVDEQKRRGIREFSLLRIFKVESDRERKNVNKKRNENQKQGKWTFSARKKWVKERIGLIVEGICLTRNKLREKK